MIAYRRFKTLILLSLTMTQAAATPPVMPAEILQDSIVSIAISLDESGLQQFGATSAALAIKQQIASNLSAWSFPVQVNHTQRSHGLHATIGPLHHGSTPAGFSFGSGNSDPRALEFQKADLITLSCSLFNMQHPTIRFELTQSVSALAPFLTEQLSTLCFDVLNKLPRRALPHATDPTEPTLSKPGWIPGIRVEIQEQTLPDVHPAHIQDQAVEESSSQKNLIIHNQGNPLTITIGHERK